MIKKQLFLCFLACLSMIDKNAKAQQEKGQIAISAGIGYSPGFDGDLSFGAGPLYPIGITQNAIDPGTNFSDIVPNIGGAIDYGLYNVLSVGIASSYQSVIATPTPLASPPDNNGDKITRINLTARMLGHLNKTHRYFDHYIGMRFGGDYWSDVPQNPMNHRFFLYKSPLFDHSFQFLYGMRIYFTNNVGIHFEIGLGSSPYLAETGLTFKISTRKNGTALQSNYGGMRTSREL